jgi:hypothetical protein
MSLPSANIRLSGPRGIIPDSATVGDLNFQPGSTIYIDPLPSVRRCTASRPSRYLPRGVIVPSPETFDANVDELYAILGGEYEIDLVIASLIQGQNSQQVAANLVMSHSVSTVVSAPPAHVRSHVPVNQTIAESPIVVELRNAVLEENGLAMVLGRLAQNRPELAEAVGRDPEPFLMTLGLPVVRDGAVFRSVTNVRLDIEVESAVHIARLTRLGYRYEDVLHAWAECGGNAEEVERRLRG